MSATRTKGTIRRLPELLARAVPAALLLSVVRPGAAQEAEGQAVMVEDAVVVMSTTQASLQLDFAAGDRVIALVDGEVRIDGVPIAEYEPGGVLETGWREFLRGPAAFEPHSLPESLSAFVAAFPPDAGDVDGLAIERLRAALDDMLGSRTSVAPGAAEAVPTANGERLTIAPGALSVEALTRRLERLEGALARLGDDVPSADGLALVVHDDYRVAAERVVPGHVALLGGTLQLAGSVAGDVLVLDGQLILEPSSRVEGNVLQVGGDVERRGGRITGELRSLVAVGPTAVPVPDAEVTVDVRPDAVVAQAIRAREPGFFGRLGNNIGEAVHGLFTALSFWIGLGLLGALAVYFVRDKLEVVADTARQHIARSFAVGVAGELLFFPVLLVLAVAIITWLLVPFYLIAVALALIGGYLAVAHATGEMLAKIRHQGLQWLRRSNSYYYVLSGLAALLGLFVLAAVLRVFGGLTELLFGLSIFAGVLLTWFAATTGFGAVILSRAGIRRDYVWRTRTDADVLVEETEYAARESTGG